MKARHRLRQSDEGLKLSHSVAVGRLDGVPIGSCLTKLLVLVLEELRRVTSELRLESSAHFDVGLQLGHRELWLQRTVLQAVHVDNVARNLEVLVVLLLVKDNEEEVEARHDRC